jgi:HEAT repeat protein
MSHRAPGLLLAAALILTVHGLAHSQPAVVERVAARPDEIGQMIKLLGADKFSDRERATRRLLAIGKSALPAVHEATRHSDAEIASRAQRILMEIQTSLPYLLECLKDPDVKLRREAALGLEQLGEKAKEALADLVEALKDKDEMVREAAVGAILSIDPFHQSIAQAVPAKAHVNGKYAKLLRRIRVPDDKVSYSEYRDYGHYQACDWAGFTNIPAGYWVYVYPNWYIWGDCKER